MQLVEPAEKSIQSNQTCNQRAVMRSKIPTSGAKDKHEKLVNKHKGTLLSNSTDIFDFSTQEVMKPKHKKKSKRHSSESDEDIIKPLESTTFGTLETESTFQVDPDACSFEMPTFEPFVTFDSIFNVDQDPKILTSTGLLRCPKNGFVSDPNDIRTRYGNTFGNTFQIFNHNLLESTPKVKVPSFQAVPSTLEWYYCILGSIISEITSLHLILPS